MVIISISDVLRISRPARVVALVLLACLSMISSVYALDAPYTTSGDYLMFDIDQKIIYCEGHAELLSGMTRIQAEEIRVDVKNHVVYAEGRVTIESMISRTLRESAVESQEAGKHREEGGITPESSQEETNRQIEAMEESVRKSNIQTFEGNVLLYDLVRKAGALVKTDVEVRKIYLQGETLDVVSELPLMSQPAYLYEEPSVMANAWTAKRVRVSDDGRYEAWGAMVWFKGNKVLSVPLPYYTNSGKGMTPGNLRLKRVSYSSNSDWNVGGVYEYSEKKGREGNVNLNYSADGSQWYTASVNQHFNLGKRLGGNIGLGNILSSRQNYSLSFTHYGSGSQMRSFRGSFDKTGGKRFSLNSNRKIAGVDLTSLVTSSSSSGTAGADLKAMIRTGGRTKYMDRKKKYSYRVNSSMEWANGSRTDSDATMFVGVSVFRSAIRISRRSNMNTSFNVGYGRDTGGYSRDSYSTSLRYNLKVGNNKNMGLSYKVGQSRSNGDPNASQYVSLSYSYSKVKLLSMRLSTSYDLRENRLGTMSTRLSYDFNDRFGIWSDLVYDVKDTRFNIKNYSMRYDLYGSMLNTRWYVESNDFVMDVATSF